MVLWYIVSNNSLDAEMYKKEFIHGFSVSCKLLKVRYLKNDFCFGYCQKLGFQRYYYDMYCEVLANDLGVMGLYFVHFMGFLDVLWL